MTMPTTSTRIHSGAGAAAAPAVAPSGHSHKATPALCTGVYMPDAKKGSIADLANTALSLLKQAVELMESKHLADARSRFVQAEKVFPLSSLKDLESGSDRRIYAEVERKINEVRIRIFK